MARYTLIVGTRNWSSWSLRPYVALKATGAPFEVVDIRLRQTEAPTTREQILNYSPAGKVPVLKIDGSASSSEAVGQSKKSRYPISYLEFALGRENKAVKLTLTHRPIPAEFQKQTAMGWHTMLALVEAGLNGECPKRSDLFPVNAALYGVDINTLQR